MKLHLGCGPRYIPGWLHIDVIDYPHVKICHEVDRLPMVADQSVSVIYACHVLEHFMRAEAPRVLAEWYRVLRPGGMLRVAVPDIEALARLYLELRAADPDSSAPLAAVIGPLFGRQESLYGFHHTVWDLATLRLALLSAGFARVERYDWRETEHSMVDDYSQAYYPHMHKDSGVLLSLNVEATR